MKTASLMLRLPLVPAGTRLDPLDCDQHRCRVSGSAAAMEDVAHLLRALQTDGGVPELEIIERQPDARYRFRIMVAAR